ncbi:sodium-dependent bicarbonate transport family permease [Pleionea sediminis]|uniref:sodium-dependent bicarbonate transport family permease n=1 Tax=Pleionea sediminis TaxID=2569479 RepID=UPI001184E424|nr:sodium-dependent bicarbonate transport family permease [Pleionea sediminis]
MSIDAVVLFFIFGAVIRILKVDFQFPESLSRTLMLILLIAIGLKGGIALKEHATFELVIQGVAVIAIGVVIPLIAFPILRFFGGIDTTNSASIAAHYGSVSVGTFAVAIAIIDSLGIPYESYFALFVVLLEIPAIIVGIFLAQKRREKGELSTLIHEMFLNPGIVFMLGGLIIGAVSNDSINSIMPLFKGLFSGVLALFLLEMGIIAASRLKELKKNGLFIVAFSVFMPMVGALIGGAVGHFVLSMSTGGVALLAVLAASSSYIAVPAAMRVALPSANHSMSIAASLGVTFPFNVLVGIPIYILLAQVLSQSL